MIRTIYKKHHEQGNFYIVAVGLSTDEKPTQNLVTGSTFYEIDTGAVYRYDETGGGWLEADSAGLDVAGRVSALEGSSLASGAVVESVGIPAYVSDVTQYSAYGIADPGWYSFARITSPDGTLVSAETTVTGAAGYIATPGAAFVDVAVKFGVTAMSQAVTINWGAATETYVFKATDLAIRNLDYRTTFYLYDLAPFVTWTYALTTDASFVATKDYYTLADGVYTKTAESVKYALTEDATFASGKTYYTLADGVYSAATVTADEAVPADTYYELAAVPADTYYTHSKVTFAGMTRNVTYKFDEIIDCPIEIALPEVEDDGYGAWFEIQLRYNGSYSCTLLPPEGVKIGTVSTQSQTAGINVIDLQYTGVGGVAMWSLLNTHSNIPD